MSTTRHSEAHQIESVISQLHGFYEVCLKAQRFEDAAVYSQAMKHLKLYAAMMVSGDAITGMTEHFLNWPLPKSVCSDLCVTMRDYPHRWGTNLLTAVEAKQMFTEIVGPVVANYEQRLADAMIAQRKAQP